MMRNAHVDDEIAGYLLDMVDARQRGRIAAHLAGCSQCARVRRDQALVLAPLAADVDDVVPPLMLKRGLLAEARASLEPEPAPAPQRTPVRPHSLLPFRLDPASSNRFLRWASLWMAAAFIIGLVGGVTGWALVLGDRLDRKSNELDASRDTLETLIHSDAIATMDGNVGSTPVRGAIGVQPSGTGMLVVNGIPPASTGQGYQLWLFSNGTAQSAGMVTPDSHGDIVARVEQEMRRYERMQLDLEPLGASAPGGQVVLAGALP
jgi:hypothetical protein